MRATQNFTDLIAAQARERYQETAAQARERHIRDCVAVSQTLARRLAGEGTRTPSYGDLVTATRRVQPLLQMTEADFHATMLELMRRYPTIAAPTERSCPATA